MRLKTKTRGLALLLCVSLCCGVFVARADAEESVRNVRVGYFLYAGYHEIDGQGNRSGYGFEYLQEIAKKANWKYEYIGGSWQECQQMLEDGRIDLLTSAQYSESRAQKFDFASTDIGKSSAILTTKAGNKTYAYEDWEGYDGMTVGLINGNSRNNQLEALAVEHGITLNKKYYDDEGNLEKALQEEEIEAILTSDLRQVGNEQIIAKFSPSPYYCIVKKGNTELLSELNAALNSLQLSNPQIKYSLYSKYYGKNNGAALVLTKSEQDYLSDAKTATIVGVPEMEPYSYYQGGVYMGIVRNVLDEIQRAAGLTFNYVEAASQAQCIEMIQSGQADMIANFYNDYNLAENSRLKLSNPYLSVQYSAVTKKGAGQADRVAVLKDSYESRLLAGNLHRPEDIFAFSSYEACIMAVEQGVCDITYMNTYMADRVVRNREHNDLSAVFVPGYTLGFTLAVSDAQDARLYSIMDKAVQHLNQDTVTSIVAAHTLFQPGTATWAAYLYDNPLQVILALSFIFLCVLALVLVLLLSKRKYARHMHNLAYIDSLTGLGNTFLFYEAGAKLLKEHKSKKMAIISIDVRKFSMVNDNYGRYTGDKILRFIAMKMQKAINNVFLLVRDKSDHFLALLPYESIQDINDTMSRFFICAGSFEDHGVRIKIHYDCGVYLVPGGETDIITAVDFAQVARKQSKVDNRIGIVFFDVQMEQRLKLEKEIEDTMEAALENGEFKVYYQPKFNMRNGAVIGAEALVRWDSSTKGFLSPAMFIPVLEKNFFIIELDYFVLEEVYKLLRQWIDKGKTPIPISVNQSRAHLREEHYVERLHNIMKKYDIPAGLVELELTETSFTDTDDVLEIVKKIRDLGFTVSLDDFGSGYSSLTLLNKVPLDVLKIDREFLRETGTSGRSKTIVKKVVEMAKELDMEVICEGVETGTQVEFLLDVGCDKAQGFLFARPMSAAKFEEKMEGEIGC